MNVKKYTVEVQPDFIERQAKVSPVQAVAELVWNGLDADAENVDVRLEVDELGGTTVVVRDDGTGMPYDDAPGLFTRLGCSWKKTQHFTPRKARSVHGREGRGRLKVFAIGRCAEWRVRYLNEVGEIRQYSITMHGSSIEEIQISSEEASHSRNTGVEARISEIDKQYHVLKADTIVSELNDEFALYSNNHRDVSIFYDDHQIAARTQIISSHSVKLKSIDVNSRAHEVVLDVMEWSCNSRNALYLCTHQGFPVMEVSANVREAKNYNVSAYLKSTYIESLASSQQSQVMSMNPKLRDAIQVSRGLINTYLCNRYSKTGRTVVDEWKSEGIYPFKDTPMNDIQNIERKLFDILAATYSDFPPGIQSGSQERKALELRLLKMAIECGSSDLQSILIQIFGWPSNKRRNLAELSKYSPLLAAIRAVKIVTDRLGVLVELEEILSNTKTKQFPKHYARFRKILEDNIWIFGDEYTLSVSDKSLASVLRKHQHLLGETVQIDDSIVEHPSMENGTVDVVLSRTIRRHCVVELEHLIIQIKDPCVKFSGDQITRIREYAFAVTRDDELMSDSTQWVFWVIVDDVDEFARFLILEGEQARGTIQRKRNFQVMIKSWSQVLADNRTRLRFFQEKVKCSAEYESSLSNLQSKYDEVVTGFAPRADRDRVGVQ